VRFGPVAGGALWANAVELATSAMPMHSNRLNTLRIFCLLLVFGLSIQPILTRLIVPLSVQAVKFWRTRKQRVLPSATRAEKVAKIKKVGNIKIDN